MKNKKRLLLSLCCALMVSTIPAGLASCNILGGGKDSSSSDSASASDVVETFEGGEYYAGGTNEAASGANALSIGADGSITLKVDGNELTGTYTYKNNSFSITFSDSTTATAIVSGDAIVLAYNGATYNFLEKVEYTVSFSVDGAISSTKNVVNGRPMSKPADPAKEGYIFVGWYSDSEFTKSFAFDSMAVTSNMTLYARFVEAGAEEYAVTLIVDGEVWKTVSTVGGIAVNLDTPDKAGFIGWWLGDKDGNISSEYKGEALKENTYLVAVFESEAPIVSVSATGISWTAKGVNNNYVVTIKGPDGQEVDSTVTGNASYAFDFASQAPGEYTVEVSLNGNVGTAKYKNKYLAAVSNFQVVGTNLVFNAVENATKYLVTCECGTASHSHIDVDNGTSTVFDFSLCDMKADGIKFTVKAMADGWMTSQSDTYAVVKNLDAMQVSVDKATETVQWNAVANAQSYDISINGTVVATGVTATSYALKGYAPATLNIQVTAKAHGYNSSVAEVSYEKKSLLCPANVQLDGAVLTWDAVAGATGYVVMVDGKALPTITSNSYTLKNEDLTAGATSCAIQVQAIGASADANSLFSDAITVNFGAMSDNVTYANGLVSWEPVLGAKGYEVQMNNGEIVSVAASASSQEIKFKNAGYFIIKVRCVKADGTRSDWATAEVEAYKTTFDVSGGSAVASVYAAAGDTIALPASAKVGYDLVGWFNTPNGTNGIEYTTLKQAAEETTVYAHWDAKKFLVKLNAASGALEETEIEVTFDQHYQLPVPEKVGSNFGGWYTEANGKGIEYANEVGASKNVWRDLDEVTLVADWIEVLQFVEVTDEENGGTGYQVIGGEDVGTVSKIRIPESYNGKAVIAIGAEAFKSCGALTTLEIPDTIQNIDTGKNFKTYSTGSALYGCVNLTNIEVYETEGGHDRHYESIDGMLVHNSHRGKVLVFVSSKLGDRQDSLVVPEGVEVIPESLFDGSTLKKVTLPSTLKEIAVAAFENAYMMEEIVFAGENADLAADNSNALVLREDAFHLCSKLKEITLPARTVLASETVADSSVPVSFGLVFNYCSALKMVNIAAPTTEGACAYTSQDGMVLNKDGSELVYCTPFRTGAIRIPTSVSTIKAEAFYNCSSITSVDIHAFVTTIEENAFFGCTSMSKVTFGGRVTDEAINIKSKAFYKCSGLSSVKLPANLGTLSAYAFGGCSGLTDVDVDVSASAVIEDAAFGTDAAAPNYDVTTVNIGANAPVMDVAAVFGSEKLMTLTLDDANPNYTLDEEGVLYNKVINAETGESYPTKILFYPVGLAVANYVIPATIEEIGAEVFTGRMFRTVTVGSKVTSIGASAFADCQYLESIIFENADAALDGNALTIANNAFQKCVRLSNLVLPVRLTTIGDTAFSGCKALAGELVIPANVTTVGKQAFQDCAGITAVKVLGAKTSFTAESSKFTVFTGCKALASVTIAEANENYVTADGIIYSKADGVAKELLYCPAMNAGQAVEADGVMTNTAYVPNTVSKVWANAFEHAMAVEAVIFQENTEAPVDLQLTAYSFMTNTAYPSQLKTVVLPKGMTKVAASSFTTSNTSSTSQFKASKITSITIPNTVTLVDSKAFAACKDLTTVIFEEGGTADLILGTANSTTANGPFNGCSALASVNLPERLTKIGAGTFYSTALTEITIPSTVVEIWNGAFQSVSDLATVNLAEGSQLTKIKGAAFRGTAITAFAFPDAVTEIAAGSFNETQLQSVKLPASLSTLTTAFQNIATLTSVEFAENNKITAIPASAFAGTGLTTITIPNNVKTIGNRAFNGCSNLAEVIFATNASGKTALTQIQYGAFGGTALTQFILPETSNSTLTFTFNSTYGMFQGCSNLTTVSLPKQVSSIGSLFAGCLTITSLSFPDNENLIFEDGIVYNKDKTAIQYVLKDIATENLVIPDGVTMIGEYAFTKQPSLKTVSLPASIKTIGSYAFQNCYNLEKVTFRQDANVAETMTAVNSYTFAGCRSLKEIVNLPSTITSLGISAFEGCHKLSKMNSVDGADVINLPASLVTLGGGATSNTCVFAECISIKKVIIPAGVKVIGGEVFDTCYALSEVVFAEGSQLTEIGNRAFEECTSLRTFDMPDTVTKLNYQVFQNSGIEEIELSAAITTMSSQVFFGATNLTEIVLPEKLVVLDYGMFEGCTNLKDVTLPAGLTAISYNVFKDCTSLEEITIPDGVAMLGQNSSWSTSRYSRAFQNCTSLKTVNLGGVTQIGDDAFNGCTALENIDLSKVTDMNDNVFMNCTSLKSVDISALKTPQYSIFQGCSNLESVKLGSALTAIGYNMFDGCVNLASIEIPASVTKVNTEAFKDCASLTELTLPSKVTSIPASMAEGCINLTDIKIEGKVTIINDFAFKNCEKLTEFTLPSSLTSALGHKIFEGTSITSITIPKAYAKAWYGVKAPFAGCDTLTEILVAPGNPLFESRDGVLYDLDNNLMAIPNGKVFEDNTFVIPEDVSVLNRAMPFAGCTFAKVVLPESMTTLPESIFRESLVEEVVLGSNVDIIEDWAFYDATALKRVLKKDAAGVAQESLEGITTFSTMAFYNTASLESIVLPDSLTSLGSSMFTFSGVKNVTIGSGITALGSSMFADSGLTSIVIPETITSVPASAFARSALTSITLPATVASWGANTFEDCVSLASVTFADGFTAIPNYMFNGCTALKSIELPATLTSIGNYAFANTGLTTIEIPASVASLGAYVFDGTALASIKLNEGLQSIANNALAGLPLTSIELPSTVTSIGTSAFAECTALKNVVLPANLTSIGATAFAYCTGISSIVVPANASVGANAFGGWTAEQTVYVTISEYEAANTWGVAWNMNSEAKFVYNYVQD